ncbi:hypothetical protein LTR17_000020 [Elasticomyces elasticus]|nr:hypothetical protein LTR17_000020 [Elasticomyces elasticus]
MAVLDKFVQYGEVYGAVFNHFDQTTQTLKPYAILQYTNAYEVMVVNCQRTFTTPFSNVSGSSQTTRCTMQHTVGWLHRVLAEEIVMVIKHAETPHRSPFAQRAIIRVYESHISTLHK